MAIISWLSNWGAKKALDELWSNYLKPLAFKDGHLRIRRLFAPGFAILAGFLAYEFPNIIPPLAEAFRYYDPSANSQSGFGGFVHRLIQDPHYHRLTQDLFAASYIAIALFVWVRVGRSSYKRLNDLYEESKAVITFANYTKLRDGSRCSTPEERALINEKIAEKIGTSKNVRIMVVNGYHDLTDPSSPIKRALDEKRAQLGLKVLLLDPLSSYAHDRAKSLRQETDEHLSWMRYIRDYMKVTAELDHLKLQHQAKVMHRVYCSKPFFRMYLFDHDLFVQAYYDNQHGHSAPMYHYEDGDGSIFRLGQEMFNFHWNRAFSFDESTNQRMKSSLAIYLAEMYGVSSVHDVANLEDLKSRIMQYSKEQFAKAKELDTGGMLTDTD